MTIARDYLLPKQLDIIPGLKRLKIDFTDDAFLTIIREYTREAGVRELERQIAAVLRKIAVDVSRNRRRKRFHITPDVVKKYLGVPKFLGSPVPEKLVPGEALGLAWTSAGGELLRVEVLLYQGEGKTKFTGSLGDVMKESINAAMSLVKAKAGEFKIDLDRLSRLDVHIHFPEGAVPKDGPSAGVAAFCAILSALTDKSLPSDTAITGEITLTGRVLAIGGLPEKLHAAKRFKIRRVLIPNGNKHELEEIKPEVLNGIEVLPISSVDEAVDIVFGKK